MGGDATSAESALFSPRRIDLSNGKPAPRELTCKPEQESTMANQFGRAPRWPCRLGYLPVGVDCSYGRLPNSRTSERSAAKGEASPICSRWSCFVGAERRPIAAKEPGDDALSKESVPFFGPLESTPSCGKNGHRREKFRGGGNFGRISIAFPAAYLPAPAGKKRRLRPN